ncbi:MAG: UDP-N-acetylglucosamine--N-acetylmuramyl-(pentapeptide) pyrophosphoryl-undecaprenol N-acetylglucosamine transferase [Candidatus Kerfeldbacteria bacterium]
MKILFAGGGTAGSVSPLLSIYNTVKKIKPETEFLFVRTKKGDPELNLLRGYSMKIQSINSGKFRRYFSLKNITDVFLTFIGFIESLFIIKEFKPDVIVGAGGYISVPVIWAGWVMRKKILIHQQDIRPSLSNILSINLANTITVAFEKSLRDFPSTKTVWTGNPSRKEILHGKKEQIKNSFGFKDNLPVVLIVGGGTGAVSLNNIVQNSLEKLVEFSQVILVTGKDKRITGIDNPRFRQYEFLVDEMKDALSNSVVVVSRAGLSAMTEFSVLGKAVILVPMPKSHQVENANYLEERDAAVVLDQRKLSPNKLVDNIQELLNNDNKRRILSDNIKKIMKKDASESITNEIIKLAEK